MTVSCCRGCRRNAAGRWTPRPSTSAKGPDLFVFFDAYQNNSPDWLEKTLKENAHRYAFVVMHPPAVPYGARSTWHLFSKAKEEAVRERFLNILGANRRAAAHGPSAQVQCPRAQDRDRERSCNSV